MFTKDGVVMARIDDYINARKIAVDSLLKDNFNDLISRSGFEKYDDKTFRFSFLDRVYKVGFPGFEFKDEAQENKEIPLQEQVLILHYMMAENVLDASSSGNLISYREIPGASFYYSAFLKRAVDPLKKAFGNNIPGFIKSAQKINGVDIKYGDAGFEFQVFPKVTIQLILWEGDDEFPPEANILFGETIQDRLSPEDVAWLAGMLVYRLMALSR